MENHNGIEQSLIAQKWEGSELTNFGFIDDLDSRMSVSNLPLSEEPESELDDLEREILAFMGSRKEVTRAELVKITGKSAVTVISRLNQLMEKGIIHRKGKKHDPSQVYIFGEK